MIYKENIVKHYLMLFVEIGNKKAENSHFENANSRTQLSGRVQLNAFLMSYLYC